MGAIIGAIMFMGCIMEPIAGTIGAIMPTGAVIIGPIMFAYIMGFIICSMPN